MKLKLDDAGHVVVQDGKPVYVYEDGKESPFDAAATLQTISRLNSEAKSHRERAEVAEKSLKAFSGITDPAAAIRALETVSNLDLKKLVDAEPSRFYNWYAYSEVLMLVGEYEDAVTVLNRAIKKHYRAELFYQLSNCFYNLKDQVWRALRFQFL